MATPSAPSDVEAAPQIVLATEGDALFPKSYPLEFGDLSIRRGFIKKVFGIVSAMLLVVTVFCLLPFFFLDLPDFFASSAGTITAIVLISLYAALTIIFICMPRLRRSYPANIICLIIYTFTVAFMMSYVTVCYTLPEVFMAMSITAVSCIAIAIFAMTTNKDLTSMIGLAFILILGLIFFGIYAIILTAILDMTIMYSVYSGLAALLFMFFLAIDIQLIMGDKSYSIHPDEYIFASLQIFLDVINIFLRILGISGGR